jgi:hypothetical protein
MDKSKFDIDPPLGDLDADAVCERCGTVNPEGTLLCKGCGNNLRDQRTRRIAGGEMEVIGDKSRRRFLLSTAMTILGLLIVVWTAINVSNGNIEEWLIRLEYGRAGSARSFWYGSQAAVYAELTDQFQRSPITEEIIAKVEREPLHAENYTGRYILKKANGSSNRVIGEACLREEGGNVYFVALIRGIAEVRGVAQKEDAGRLTAPATSAAIRIGDNYFGAFGFAVKHTDGTLRCYGQRVTGKENLSPIYAVAAYRVP